MIRPGHHQGLIRIEMDITQDDRFLQTHYILGWAQHAGRAELLKTSTQVLATGGRQIPRLHASINTSDWISVRLIGYV